MASGTGPITAVRAQGARGSVTRSANLLTGRRIRRRLRPSDGSKLPRSSGDEAEAL